MRESGYYFVLYHGNWEPALWDSKEKVMGELGAWFITGRESSLDDSDFDEIDERKIVREEPMDFEQTREALKKDYEYLCREYERLSGKQWKEPLPKLKIFGR